MESLPISVISPKMNPWTGCGAQTFFCLKSRTTIFNRRASQIFVSFQKKKKIDYSATFFYSSIFTPSDHRLFRPARNWTEKKEFEKMELKSKALESVKKLSNFQFMKKLTADISICSNFTKLLEFRQKYLFTIVLRNFLNSSLKNK